MTGVTYVMTHGGYRSVKVGYTTPDSLRLSGLRRGGWEPFRQLVSDSASIAREVEQATLFELRFRLYIPAHLTRAQMRGVNGWTETSSMKLIDPDEVWELVCEQGALEQLAPVVGRPRFERGLLGGPAVRGVRRPGDTPRYVKAARTEASRTARSLRVGAPKKPKFKNTRPEGPVT